mmetsp:Transcript_43914/g.122133  ORF Transcript_43914/g.122133 Transcript_43914/m.122133 type:complete len:315 (-) Transcript_43914:135-1079(-)
MAVDGIAAVATGIRLILDSEVPLELCMRALSVESLLSLSAAFSTARCVLWTSPEAIGLCEQLASQELHAQVLSSARESLARACSTGGPASYCATLVRACLRATRLRRCVEVVSGSVADINRAGSPVAGLVEAVACPCRSDLLDLGIGAQAAIRYAAGQELERAINNIKRREGFQPEASVRIVPGGELAAHVAVTITEVPPGAHQCCEVADRFLAELHGNLLRAVRVAGLRSLALPTLCTGGQGLDPRRVCTAAARSMLQDFCKHPAQQLRVVVCCFEPAHKDLMEGAWSKAVETYLQQLLSASEHTLADGSHDF